MRDTVKPIRWPALIRQTEDMCSPNAEDDSDLTLPLAATKFSLHRNVTTRTLDTLGHIASYLRLFPVSFSINLSN